MKKESFVHRIQHVFDFLSLLFLLFASLVESFVSDILRSEVISLSTFCAAEFLVLLFASFLSPLKDVSLDSFIATRQKETIGIFNVVQSVSFCLKLRARGEK